METLMKIGKKIYAAYVKECEGKEVPNAYEALVGQIQKFTEHFGITSTVAKEVLDTNLEQYLPSILPEVLNANMKKYEIAPKTHSSGWFTNRIDYVVGGIFLLSLVISGYQLMRWLRMPQVS